ncbi:MAG: hypothetical protein V7640_719, partial [Betaproteobacteria bacterium]
MTGLLQWVAVALSGFIALPASGAGMSGALVLHGKGETSESVVDLADTLRRENVIVATPEMPWSARRLYDR